MSETNWGNLAVGLGSLVIVGAVANKVLNNKPMFKQPKPMKLPKSKMKWGL